MIITNQGETVEGTITALQTEGFKIANTAHMMEILSKRLYTNPELAVCRELVCNAIDAHRAVNSTRKVEVTLPDWSNDYRFIVKDYGTGMDEEDVMTLYTTYGASTKQSSNDFIGCLGIGSKSPFAVTEEFSVVSRYNGKATTYHCYKQKGMPVCTKLSEVATDEHNGMTITVPFQRQSAEDFVQYSERFFEFVDKGLVSVSSADRVIKFFEDSDYKFVYADGDNSLYYYQCYYGDNKVRMGQVAYEIPRKWVSDSLLSLSQNTYCLDVPIGTFTIAASRESIEDNTDNANKFIKIVNDIRQAYIDKELGHILKTAKTVHTYKELYKKVSVFRGIEDVINKAYENNKINTRYPTDCSAMWTQHKNGKLTSARDTYAYHGRKDDRVVCIVPDEEPVVSLGILLKKWSSDDQPISYFVLKSFKDTSYKTMYNLKFAWNVVFVSQLNKWHDYLQEQAKRRRKTATKKVKTEEFTVYELGSNPNIRYKKSSKDFTKTDTVPYIVLKELKPVDEEDIARVEKISHFKDSCYGISLVNAKDLPENYVPLKDYIKANEKRFDDEEYIRNKEKVVDYIKKAKRNYVSSSYRSILGKYYKLYSLTQFEIPLFNPRTDADRKVVELVKMSIKLKKFLTEDLSWLNVYSYDKAPEEIKGFVQKLLKDKVVSSESTANK